MSNGRKIEIISGFRVPALLFPIQQRREWFWGVTQAAPLPLRLLLLFLVAQQLQQQQQQRHR
jgi:hypothetical protein